MTDVNPVSRKRKLRLSKVGQGCAHQADAEGNSLDEGAGPHC